MLHDIRYYCLSFCQFKYFICGLFDTVSNPDYVALNIRMINEMERMWKEVIMACFKELSQHLPERTEENHFSWYRWSLGSDLNPGPPKYEGRVLTT